MAVAQEGPCVRHDISMPVSAIPEFVRDTDRRIHDRWPDAQIVNFGHAGDGNLHYNVFPGSLAASGGSLGTFEQNVNDVVFDAVCAKAGSITAEHGVGVSKREAVSRRKDPVALDLMRRIKFALDPGNLLNPGKVLAESSYAPALKVAAAP